MDYLMIILQAVGNVMAGIMLKTIKSCRPGYYITVGDHFGRITTMGLLAEVNRLLGKRRELRVRTMDALHMAGIEIVSPNFMNTRNFDTSERLAALIDRKEAKISED